MAEHDLQDVGRGIEHACMLHQIDKERSFGLNEQDEKRCNQALCKHFQIDKQLDCEEQVEGQLKPSVAIVQLEQTLSTKQRQQGKFLPLGFKAAGLTCALTQSLSLQSFPRSHGSLLRTIPLSTVATGEGCEYRQWAFVHFKPNLHSVGDEGRSGTEYAGVAATGAAITGVGATGTGTTDGVGGEGS